MPLFINEGEEIPVDPPTRGYYFKVGAQDGQNGYPPSVSYADNVDYNEGWDFGRKQNPYLESIGM